VTERAVFELRDGKVVLTEIAPGIDLEKDILNQMGFKPVLADHLTIMNPAIFNPARMIDTDDSIFKYFSNNEQKMKLVS
jgi:propionate CoA-transferase